MVTRIERALQLLRDLEYCRIKGDRYQGGMVETLLEELDTEGGYRRRAPRHHKVVPTFGESANYCKSAQDTCQPPASPARVRQK